MHQDSGRSRVKIQFIFVNKSFNGFSLKRTLILNALIQLRPGFSCDSNSTEWFKGYVVNNKKGFLAVGARAFCVIFFPTKFRCICEFFSTEFVANEYVVASPVYGKRRRARTAGEAAYIVYKCIHVLNHHPQPHLIAPMLSHLRSVADPAIFLASFRHKLFSGD